MEAKEKQIQYLNSVADVFFNITGYDVRNAEKTRKQEVMLKRKVFVNVVLPYVDYSIIGKFTGIDRTSVYHYERTHKADFEQNFKNYAVLFKKLQDDCRDLEIEFLRTKTRLRATRNAFRDAVLEFNRNRTFLFEIKQSGHTSWIEPANEKLKEITASICEKYYTDLDLAEFDVKRCYVRLFENLKNENDPI
jgi:hypothetical protein